MTREEVIKNVNTICDAFDMLKKLNDDEVEFHIRSSILCDGVLYVAECLGVEPIKGGVRVYEDEITQEYHFNYRDCEFFDYITVGHLSEVVK